MGLNNITVSFLIVGVPDWGFGLLKHRYSKGATGLETDADHVTTLWRFTVWAACPFEVQARYASAPFIKQEVISAEVHQSTVQCSSMQRCLLCTI